jgi:hypothetical protein
MKCIVRMGSGHDTYTKFDDDRFRHLSNIAVTAAII